MMRTATRIMTIWPWGIRTRSHGALEPAASGCMDGVGQRAGNRTLPGAGRSLEIQPAALFGKDQPDLQCIVRQGLPGAKFLPDAFFLIADWFAVCDDHRQVFDRLFSGKGGQVV